MCKQRVALEMIESQPEHWGMSEGAMFIHEKQCEDFEAMQKEINEIKNDVSVIKRTQENVIKTTAEMNKKIDDLTNLVERKSSFWGNVKEMLGNKIVTYSLCVIFIAVLAISVGKFGVVLLKWLGFI